MISRLDSSNKVLMPAFAIEPLRTESDVEQKLLYPFLTHPSYLNLPSDWVRTKAYMTPTEIDKTAGKRFGYFPDYSVWISGLPIVIVEAKIPDVAIEYAMREARLYAMEINKRYAPNVNPIAFILACNGVEFSISPWDSETEIMKFLCSDAQPGTIVLEKLQKSIGKIALEEIARNLLVHFQTRTFFNVSSFMGGQSRVSQQLGVNEFAEPLFPTLTKYFGAASDEIPDDVIDRAYVTSDELGSYESVLETYLKDRAPQLAGNQLVPVATTKNQASGISNEVQKFASNPNQYSRVQLVIGAVGAGKSSFVRRYYRHLMSIEVKNRTRWSFLNFNVLPPNDSLQEWVAKEFINSYAEVNKIDIHDLDQIEKILAVELNQFDRGANKRLRDLDFIEFEKRRSSYISQLTNDSTLFAKALARHFSGEMGFGIVVVFDNVDKRSRDLQLAIFEAAQWFKDLTRALVIVNLRDTTFEAHRDEPPLDAFSNAINFYIQPPRFAQVIRKRLELVLEVLPEEVSQHQEYSLPSGYRIRYPASRLGRFLMTIYLSLFDQRSLKVASALEALVAKDVRRALGMFADILVSPHIPTSQITAAILSEGENRIQEYRIIRSLMRQRYKYYNGKTTYIRNLLDVDVNHNRPSCFIYADVLEYLVRNRKAKIDFAQEGYATLGTLKKKLGLCGYDDEDITTATRTLLEWGLLESDSLVSQTLNDGDAVRMHATGFIHMRFFVERLEYLVGITPDMKFASREAAEEIGNTWASQADRTDLSMQSKKKVLERLKLYVEHEYSVRCRRHAFYEEFGLGGRVVVTAIQKAYLQIQVPSAHISNR